MQNAAPLDTHRPQTADNPCIDIVVIWLPRIANFDDFDALAAEPGVRVRYVDQVELLGQPAAVILPGTKSTIPDLLWLRERGLADALCRLAQNETAVVGICGGYQMLGTTVAEPQRVESAHSVVAGLGLLLVYTIFSPEKTTHDVDCEANPPHPSLALQFNISESRICDSRSSRTRKIASLRVTIAL